MKKDFVSLAEARPDLAKEWNYEKNGDLKPEDVSCGSHKKVWWIQHDKSPVTGKIMKLEWEAIIFNRTIHHQGNPIKQGQKTLKNYNDLESLRPDLASEWNYKRNGDLKPDMVTCGSNKKVWWIQYDKSPVTNQIMKLEWEAKIADRNKGSGNPIKSGHQVVYLYNDLLSLRPDIAKEWNYERNGDLKPDMVTCNSTKKVWWIQYDKSPVTGKVMKLEWKAVIYSRVLGSDNPIKAGKITLKNYNDLASLYPDLAKEWNYERNGSLTPDMVTCGSHKKVWWIQYDKSPVTGDIIKLEWEASINNRIKKRGCPQKAGVQILKGYNDLASLYPDLAAEWNYERNGDLTPDMVACGSGQKVWWIQYDKSPVTGEVMKLEWEALICNRVSKKSQNPIKAGKIVLKNYNDLASLYPDLAAEWNYERNGNLTPDIVTCGSNKKVWWIQYDKNPVTGDMMKLEWEASIVNRVQGNGNPVKSGRKVLEHYNDLALLRPDLAAEWNYERNGDLTPDMVTCGSRQKVWWIQYDKSPITGEIMKLEWMAPICIRVYKNIGCPIKAGKIALKNYNDLASLRPDLTSEWDYERNGDLTPDMVTCGSGQKVWWIQYDKSPITGEMMKLEWKASISNRALLGRGNPIKHGAIALKNYNDLASLRPDLASEWNYERNGNLSPDMVTCGCNKKVWWIQYDKNPITNEIVKFEWKTSINARANRNSGNPYITKYKGEEYIKQYLQKNNISFNVQQKFSDLLGTGDGQLSYDFSIPNEKYGHILIEYNGIQHYEAVDYFGGEEKFKIQKEHDKRKRDYAKKHGYKLITVKYTYDTYESVEEYLDKELKKLGVINDTKKEESVNDAA